MSAPIGVARARRRLPVLRLGPKRAAQRVARCYERDIKATVP
jgi:hypothetical protein